MPASPWGRRSASLFLAGLAVAAALVGSLALARRWELVAVAVVVAGWYLGRLFGTFRRESFLSAALDPERPFRRDRRASRRWRASAQKRAAADEEQALRREQSNDFEGAERAWRHAAEAERPSAELGLGRMLRQLERMGEAERAFRRAAELARAKHDKAQFEAAQDALEELGAEPEPPLDEPDR